MFLSASAVYYSHRVMFLAQKGTDEGHGDSFGGDIVAICDDLTERMDSRKASLAETALEVTLFPISRLSVEIYFSFLMIIYVDPFS